MTRPNQFSFKVHDMTVTYLHEKYSYLSLQQKCIFKFLWCVLLPFIQQFRKCCFYAAHMSKLIYFKGLRKQDISITKYKKEQHEYTHRHRCSYINRDMFIENMRDCKSLLAPAGEVVLTPGFALKCVTLEVSQNHISCSYMT